MWQLAPDKSYKNQPHISSRHMPIKHFNSSYLSKVKVQPCQPTLKVSRTFHLALLFVKVVDINHTITGLNLRNSSFELVMNFASSSRTV